MTPLLEIQKAHEGSPIVITSVPLCDLHIHLGASVAPHIMWSIAHSQGFKLPVKDFWEFKDMVTVDPSKCKGLDDYLRILHEWTERIQSSPAAVERSVYEIIGKEYRGSRVEQIELRFNPMKRNQEGRRDLDHIIHAALRGMDRACLEYGVKAGLILCLAREFDADQNEKIVKKAIQYQSRGVIGVDLAGTETNSIELTSAVDKYAKIFADARAAGLGTTIHTGETKSTSGEGVIAVLKKLKPDRIGHGIRAAYNEEALDLLAETQTVLEICLTSNLHTRAVLHLEEFRFILNTFVDHNVPITINTDGTYLCNTNLEREFNLLGESSILTSDQLEVIRKRAFEASFLPA
jgi:adenosine deaminase